MWLILGFAALGLLTAWAAIITGISFLFAIAPWLLGSFLLIGFCRTVTTGENAKFWRGSALIKVINVVSVISLMLPLIYIAEWHFSAAVFVSCIATFLLDVMLYTFEPKTFD